MKQKTLNILGAIYVTVAIALATFCSPPTFNWTRVIEKPTCTVDQETGRVDRYNERLFGPSGIPETPEYVDGQPVKYQNSAGKRVTLEETATKKTKAEVKYPSNYLLIWTAEWCSPCKYMKAVGSELTEEGFDVFYIDFDKNQEKAKRDNIAGLPVAVIYTSGEEVKRIIGISKKSQKKQEKRIREVLKKNKKDSIDYIVY